MASKIIDRRHHRTNPWYEQITNVVKFTEAKEEETYYSIKPLDYVSIIVKTNENKFIIVEQYRPAVNQITYESQEWASYLLTEKTDKLVRLCS